MRFANNDMRTRMALGMLTERHEVTACSGCSICQRPRLRKLRFHLGYELVGDVERRRRRGRGGQRGLENVEHVADERVLAPQLLHFKPRFGNSAVSTRTLVHVII